MPSSVDLGKRLERAVDQLVKEVATTPAAKRRAKAFASSQEREARLTSLDVAIARGVADAIEGRVTDAAAAFDRLAAATRQAARRRQNARSAHGADLEGRSCEVGNRRPRVHRGLDRRRQPGARRRLCPVAAQPLPAARRHAARLPARPALRIDGNSPAPGGRLPDLLPNDGQHRRDRPRPAWRPRLRSSALSTGVGPVTSSATAPPSRMVRGTDRGTWHGDQSVDRIRSSSRQRSKSAARRPGAPRSPARWRNSSPAADGSACSS